MAALGAGAGAFEGDNARAQRAAQAAQRAEQARQFDAQLQQRQAENKQAAAERAQNREDTLNMRAEDRDWRQQESQRMQSNADRQFGLQAGGQEFSQQRAEKQDEWTKALNEQNMARQKQEMEFATTKFEQWKTLADQEREELSQRKLLGQTGMASLMRLAQENGGVAPLRAVQAVGKDLGLDLEGAFFAEDGQFVVNAFSQDQQGRRVAVPNFFTPAVQAQMMRSMPGIFGEAAAKAVESSATDKREHAQAMERDKLRYDSYAERKPTVVSAGDKAKLGALSDELKEAYDYLRYAAPEDKPQAQTHVDALLAQIDAIEGGGQARPAQSPQSDIQTRAQQIKAEVVKKYGNTPRAREEYERIMKMSMQGRR
ncbi:MAG: hypothetical protein RBS99_08415 [Rhodospirillales bacterium]|jgi:hypothetical protein|nr:hypothetical protein [Rhodospirillales bacterium]